jgi:branched-chain amino acid transport system ATP-binding protein
MMVILESENIVAGYGKGPDILKGISLSVEICKTYCIIGPNGAGKSTFLKVISGLLNPRAGRIRYKGEDITGWRADQILRKGICLVPSDRSLFPDMTVHENLRMGGYVLKNQKEIDQRIDEVCETFPFLAKRRSQQAKTLSGGQQQQLAIGRALVLRPELIMLDEPTLGLAPKVSKQIFDSIEILKNAGMTVIIVEQNARRGLEAADWGVVLDLGKNCFDAEAQKVLLDERIQELYLGKRH